MIRDQREEITEWTQPVEKDSLSVCVVIDHPRAVSIVKLAKKYYPKSNLNLVYRPTYTK